VKSTTPATEPSLLVVEIVLAHEERSGSVSCEVALHLDPCAEVLQALT
jgi:hypothetical protein